MSIIGQLDRPEVIEAIDRVKKACLQKDIRYAIFAPDARSAMKAKKEGFSLISVGIDIVSLWKTARSTLDRIKSD